MDGVAAFVRLEVSDQVPLEAGGAEADFGFGLLNSIFAEEGKTQLGRRANNVSRLALGNGDKGYNGGIASGAGAGCRNALADSLQIGYLLVYGLVVVCLFRPNKYGVRRRWLALDYVWVVLGILTGIGLVMLWFMQHQRG